jgi:hypothetical protein
VRALHSHLIAWPARAHAATVVAGTKVEGAALAFDRWFGEGSASHCGGGHDR